MMRPLPMTLRLHQEILLLNMKITQEFNTAHHVIKSYSDAGFIIGDREFAGSVIVTDENLLAWSPVFPDMLAEAEMQSLADLKPELILLGTGKKLRFPATSFMAFFMQQGIGFEVMDTAAACRTYNVLVAESRIVIAALVCEPL